jgi:hypothetical protein
VADAVLAVLDTPKSARQQKQRKPFPIKGADGPLEYAPGEYYVNGKDRCRGNIQETLSKEARQVYAFMELGSIAYRQELCIVSENGKRRPMTPGDIREATGLSKQNVRRALEEIENAGKGERRAQDGGPPRSGEIPLIYSWAFPRTPQKQGGGSQRATTFPAWFPAEWEPLKALLKRKRVVLSTDAVVTSDYLETVAKLARDYLEAEKVVLAALESVSAPSPLYKEERKERKESFERNGTPPPTPSPQAGEGRSDPPQSKENPKDAQDAQTGRVEHLQSSPEFRALRFAADQANLTYSEGQLKFLERAFDALSPPERRQAIDVIHLRIEIGQYPAFSSTLKRYLVERLWTEAHRPRATRPPNGKPPNDRSFDDAVIAGIHPEEAIKLTPDERRLAIAKRKANGSGL